LDTRIEELTRERDTARTDCDSAFTAKKRDQLTEERDGALNNITSLQQERDKIDPRSDMEPQYRCHEPVNEERDEAIHIESKKLDAQSLHIERPILARLRTGMRALSIFGSGSW